MDKLLNRVNLMLTEMDKLIVVILKREDHQETDSDVIA
jgi:hypothetical protein